MGMDIESIVADVTKLQMILNFILYYVLLVICRHQLIDAILVFY